MLTPGRLRSIHSFVFMNNLRKGLMVSLVCAIMSVFFAAAAAQTDSPPPLDLLVRAALDRHPDLRAAAREPAYLEASYRAHFRPEPLAARGYYMPFSDAGDLYTEWEVVAGFNGPRLVRATRAFTDAAVSEASAEVGVLRQQVAAELLSAGISVWSAEQQITLLTARLEDARGLAEWARDRRDAGLETDATASSAAFAALHLEVELDRLQSARNAGRSDLAVWFGSLPEGPIVLPVGWGADGPQPAADSAVVWARADARWEAALRSGEAAARQLEVESVARGPRWQAGWNTQGVPTGVYRGVTVGLAVPVFGRDAGREAAEVAAAAALDRQDAVHRELAQQRSRDIARMASLAAARNELGTRLAADGGEAALREALLAGALDFPAFSAALAARRAAEDLHVELDAELLQLRAQLLIHTFK